MILRRLAPVDEEEARTELAGKLGIARDRISQIIVVDWIIGEVLVTFHGDRKPQTMLLDPDMPVQPPSVT